jgi:hypothetical protein
LGFPVAAEEEEIDLLEICPAAGFSVPSARKNPLTNEIRR